MDVFPFGPYQRLNRLRLPRIRFLRVCLVIGAMQLLPATSQVVADDWPQYQGLQRDNISSETGLLQEWPEAGPDLAWSFNKAGLGYSSPAVVDGRVYLTGGRNGRAELFCLDARNGKEIWSLPLNSKSFDFEGNAWGAGPRAAPLPL